MEIKTNDLILRTVTENDIKEIARMREQPEAKKEAQLSKKVV